MNAILTIDKGGRVVLPKSLRDELRLEPGDTLELVSEDQKITLRPIKNGSSMRRERGVWVFQGSKKIPLEATNFTLEKLRNERDKLSRDS